jgi:hypothetical protein
MSDRSGKAREIDLGKDFSAVVVRVNGATIDVGADGNVAVNTPGAVELQSAVNVDAKSKIGVKTDNGCTIPPPPVRPVPETLKKGG